jgi:lipopolysaccharide transport system ATP-binding protein
MAEDSTEMSSELVLQTENLGKKFCRSFRRSLMYGVVDLAREIGLPLGSGELRKHEFWALDDVSLSVRRSECLGVIGPNGAGKTTLMRILLGLVKPDRGRVRLRGRVAALIDLHAGLHPLLTGRENIFAAGSLLGMTRNEIRKQFDSIVDFAELAHALDTPVRFYSSGMAVRLGFSIATQVQPDILLIDEVLAVGDAGFRAKCYNRISDIQKNCAVVFISHILPSVSRICDRVIVLDRGCVRHAGNVQEGIHAYQELFPARTSIASHGAVIRADVGLQDATGASCSDFRHGESITVVLEFDIRQRIDDPVVNINFIDTAGEYVLQSSSAATNMSFGCFERGFAKVKATIPRVQLSHGTYSCSVAVFDRKETEFYYWVHGVAPFRITRGYPAGVAYQPDAIWSAGTNV